jgi:hypothetical protein
VVAPFDGGDDGVELRQHAQHIGIGEEERVPRRRIRTRQSTSPSAMPVG